METLSFILGIGAVLVIAVAVVLVKTVVEVAELKRLTQVYEQIIQDNDLSVHRRIDQEIDRTNKIFTDAMSHIDSRVDKLEGKTNLNLNERLKSLEEYFEYKLKTKKESKKQLLNG
jgi:flagellar motility protein MotE (MotC chaperone)